MKRTRTILAVVALLVLSLAVRQIRSISTDDAWSYDSAILLVDGVPHALTVGLPMAMLGHVAGVSVSVETPPDLEVTAGTVTGPFTTTVNIVPGTDTGATHEDTLRVAAVVSSDVPVEAQVSIVDGAGHTKTARGTSLDTVKLEALLND